MMMTTMMKMMMTNNNKAQEKEGTKWHNDVGSSSSGTGGTENSFEEVLSFSVAMMMIFGGMALRCILIHSIMVMKY